MSTGSEANPRLQKAQAFFKTGKDAATKNNFDYAIQMLQEACKLVPDNLPYRNELRMVQRRRFEHNPAKVSRLVGAKNHPIRLRAKAARAQSQWTHVLEVCEQAFVNNPWDVAAAEEASEAAEQLGLLEMAVWLLESVSVQAGDSASFFRHLAHVNELNKNFHNAIKCWERVKKIDPTDDTASRKINSLSADATIMRSGLGDAIEKSTASAAAVESFAPDSEELQRLAEAPEDRWKQEIKDQPERVGAYLELAEHYRLQDRLDDSEKVLALALKNVPGDAVLKMAYAEVQISRLHKVIQSWTRKAEEDPADTTIQEKVRQLESKLNEYEVREFRRRLALRPDDLNTRFKLGANLVKGGRPDEAIAEFQQTRSEPTLKIKSLHQLGLCFEANGNPKLAERSYHDALKALEGGESEHQSTINDLHYRLGRVAESQGRLQEAEEHFNEVAAVDFTYRDVAQRLRNLNQRPGEG